MHFYFKNPKIPMQLKYKIIKDAKIWKIKIVLFDLVEHELNLYQSKHEIG